MSRTLPSMVLIFFHVDREGMGGSGVRLYVHNSFSVDVLCTSDPLTIHDNSPEFLIYELRKDQLRLLFAAVYRLIPYPLL